MRRVAATSSQFDLNVWHFHFAFPGHNFPQSLLDCACIWNERIVVVVVVALYGVLNELEFRGSKAKSCNEDMLPRGRTANKNYAETETTSEVCLSVCKYECVCAWVWPQMTAPMQWQQLQFVRSLPLGQNRAALELTETGTEKLELLVLGVVRTVGCIWLTLLSILPSFAFAALRASLKGGRMQSRQPASSKIPFTREPPRDTASPMRPAFGWLQQICSSATKTLRRN